MVAAATVLVLVAFTMPLGLLSAIAPDLHAGPVGQAWILSSMSVGLAGALLVTGSLADDFGRRRVFLAGLGVFALGMCVAAAAPVVPVLVLARAAQGAGGAAVLASSLSLIAHAYPAGPRRVHATGVWGAMLGVGVAAGPLITQTGSWRTADVVFGGLSVCALPPSARGLTESRANEARPIDLLGAVLLAAGLITLTAGVVQGNASHWGAAAPLSALTLAALLLAAFVAHELRSRAPLFDVRLFAYRAFTGTLMASLALGAAVLAFMSYALSFMHTALGASTLAAAVWALPWSGISFLVSIRARALSKLIGTRVKTTLGLGVCAAGLLGMLGLHRGSGPAHLAPGFAVLGVGTGLLNAALAQAAVSVVPPARTGMSSGANNTARYLGAALGVPLVVGLLRTGTASRLATGQDAIAASTGAMNTVLIVVAAIAAAGATAAWLLLRAAPAPAPPSIRKVPA